jgi:hypothetical protein
MRASTVYARRSGVPSRVTRFRRATEPLEPRRLLSAAPAPVVPETTWQVLGGRRADAIVIDVSPDDAATLRATVNGDVVATRAASSVERIEVFGGTGNDDVIVSLGASSGAIGVHVDGGRGRDRLTGGDSADELDGGVGADILSGGGGNDKLQGGPGNDFLSGGEGADRLSGGRGRDFLQRQGGVDTTVTSTGDRRDTFGGDDNANTLTRLLTDGALRQWLVDAAVRQYGWAFGNNVGWGWTYAADAAGNVRTLASTAPPPPGSETGAGAGAGAPTAAGGTVADGFSRTNVQEEGVDEADLVETDGDFIYTLRPSVNTPLPPPGSLMPVFAPADSELVIADALPADAMTVASRTTVAGTALGMYLVGNRLAVVSQSYPSMAPWVMAVGGPAPLRFVAGDGASIIDPGQPNVKVTVFDVTDRAAPAVVEETTMDGSYDSSRAIGDRVYVVMRNDTWAPAPKPVDGDNGTQVYESEASYRARLDATPLAELLPTYAGKAGSTETTGVMVSAPDVYVKETDAPTCGQNMLTVAVLNVGDSGAGPSDTASVAGWAGVAYASPHALYLASQFYDGDGTEGNPIREGTNLFKFELGPDSVPLVATGEVEGTVVNQFSMDEEGDTFRIATTSLAPDETAGSPVPTLQPANGVYVLRQDGEDLKVVGSATRLGFTERIQSARFIGDTAYLVTFRRVDPLFVIDLRDPTKPKVAGELKIPGFSSYLQPVGEGLLIGIGRDADETGRARGLQLSLFDVSNPGKPVRLAAQSFGDADTYQWSEAEHNHLAVSWFPEQHVLAIPVMTGPRIWLGAPGGGGTGGSSSGAEQTTPFSLQVFRVGKDEGIQPLGQVQSEDLISRSLRIGAALYAVGTDAIRAVQLDSPGTVLGTLSLIGPTENGDDSGSGAGG